MVQLALINAVTKNEINNLGDVIGIFEDSHVFSATEQHCFDIVQVAGITRTQCKNVVLALPVDSTGGIKTKYRWRVTGLPITSGNLATKVKKNR